MSEEDVPFVAERQPIWLETAFTVITLTGLMSLVLGVGVVAGRSITLVVAVVLVAITAFVAHRIGVRDANRESDRVILAFAERAGMRR